MTSGNCWYLLMCLATFAGFSAALAYVSWQQSRMGRETVPAKADARQERESITA
jgi:hypothetical protein